jgi:predicted nuclease of predicted toxin-antitoxin system
MYARDVCQGESDDRVLSLAAAGGRIVITDDHGFGELAVRHRQPAVGVIILSLFQLPAGRRESYAIGQIAALTDRIEGKLAIIEPGRTRIRQLPMAEANDRS